MPDDAIRARNCEFGSIDRSSTSGLATLKSLSADSEATTAALRHLALMTFMHIFLRKGCSVITRRRVIISLTLRLRQRRISLSLSLSLSLSFSLIFWLFFDICMPQEAKRKQERVDAVNLSRREYPTFDLRFHVTT